MGLGLGIGTGKKKVTSNGGTPVVNDFIITVDTTIAGSSGVGKYAMPTASTSTYNCTVNWGDGNSDVITTWNDPAWTHTYAVAGTYQITIEGIFTGFSQANAGDKLKLSSIDNWGNNSWNILSFHGCSNLTANYTDNPNTTNLTTLTSLFRDCTLFNGALNIDTQNIVAMIETFRNATSFNQNIGSWDVSKVTTLVGCFDGATNFNNGGSSDINNWATTSLTAMSSCFLNASSFNQNIGAWDVSGVANFTSLFQGASSFNNGGSSDINNWITTSLTNLTSCFLNASSFNQNIGSWDVSGVTTCANTFNGATNFNNGGSSDINNWNVAIVTSMVAMFKSATSFNQPIGSWNVGNVVSMADMLRSATAFDQNIGAWDVTSCTSFNDFMRDKTNANYSASNLDAIYGNGTTTGWAFNGGAGGVLSPNEAINFGTIKYTTAVSLAGRNVLTSAPNNWIITDGGGI